MVYELQNVSLNARVQGINLVISKGQCWHFLGPNGAGKSSLLMLLAGIENNTQGTLHFEGLPFVEHSILQLAKTRCLLHQQQSSEFDILLSQLLSFYTQSSTLPAIIDDCLEINSLLNKPLSALSGGQQQRFHIARNLAQIWPTLEHGQGVILLDEPISHLDIRYQRAIMQLLQHLCSIGNTVIMSSHDVNVSQQYASHIGLLKNQQLQFSGNKDDVLNLHNLNSTFDHTFTQISDPHHAQQYFVSAVNQLI